MFKINCKDCIFCEIQNDGDGYCRAEPPKIIQSVRLNVLSKQPEGILVSVFPQCPGDWGGCGLYENGKKIIAAAPELLDADLKGGADDSN